MSSRTEPFAPSMHWIKRFLRKRRPVVPRVCNVQISNDSFLAIALDQSEQRIAWSDVDRIFTYQIDCFIYDRVWLDFELRCGDWIQIPEDSKGFDDLASAVVERFPGVSPRWFFEVTRTAFVLNFTVLYERPGRTDAATVVPN